jgi:hypothetical protein
MLSSSGPSFPSARFLYLGCFIRGLWRVDGLLPCFSLRVAGSCYAYISIEIAVGEGGGFEQVPTAANRSDLFYISLISRTFLSFQAKLLLCRKLFIMTRKIRSLIFSSLDKIAGAILFLVVLFAEPVSYM